MAQTYADADPRVLRGLAHPLRASLLYELYARGSATATDLAGTVGQPVNAVSFHLRQLAKYGLIEDDPDRAGDGRQRWWRPVASEGLRISDKELKRTKEGRAGLAVFRRSALQHWHALVERYFGEHPDDGRVWTSSDVPMMLTDDEARQCHAEVLEVLRRWHEHGKEPGAGSAERRTYLALALVMPHQADPEE
jgi:DNA-binding transcriptional ArsR family regulator